jgi:hypothetical protein
MTSIRSIFTKLHNSYTIANTAFQQKPKEVQAILYSLLVIPPILLVAVQLLILTVIPPSFTMQYIYLNFSQPTVESMFLSNYMHDPRTTAHLIQNYLGGFFMLLVLFGEYYFVVPVGKHSGRLSLDYPDRSFIAMVLVILLGVPFSISGVSILFGRVMGNSGGIGFSGIVYALMACVVFMILKMGYDDAITRTREGGPQFPNDIVNGLVFVAAFVILVPIAAILLEIGNPKVNVFAHLAGWALGLISAADVAAVCETVRERVRRAFLVILALTLIIPAVMWLLVP